MFDEEIGVYVNGAGVRAPTNTAIFRYAKDGFFHIAPALPMGE